MLAELDFKWLFSSVQMRVSNDVIDFFAAWLVPHLAPPLTPHACQPGLAVSVLASQNIYVFTRPRLRRFPILE